MIERIEDRYNKSEATNGSDQLANAIQGGAQ
jgi:hypothetical protein